LGQADGATRLKQQWRRGRQNHQMILRLPPVTDSRIGQHASMNPLALESEHGKRIMGVRLFQDLALVWQ
jgi:hypothetical protein